MSVPIRRAGSFSQKLGEEQGREGGKPSRKLNERTEKANKWGTRSEGSGSGYTVGLPASVKMPDDDKALRAIPVVPRLCFLAARVTVRIEPE